MKKILAAVAVLLSLYEIGIGWFGTLPSMQHRPLVYGILLVLLYFSTNIKGKDTKEVKVDQLIFVVLVIASCLFIFINYEWYLTRFPYVTDVKILELISGMVLVVLTLEAGRRTMGWVMPTIALVFIVYALFGANLPGFLGHQGFNLSQIVEQLTMTTEGIWGSPMHIAVTVVFMFVLFGGILSATGLGEFFMDLALCLTGRYSGGTAKTAVISSALIGTIQGSSISNVVTTGTFTIPAMKKAGFPAYFAGAVETVASCGGQIMPPIMGAAAFIMSDMTGIPYSSIMKHAVIPALLYYICCMMQVHFRSRSLGLKGLKKSEMPVFSDVIRGKGIYLLPIVLLVYLLFEGYTPMRAGFMAIASLFVIAVILTKDRKKLFIKIFNELEAAPRGMITIVAAVANAGIIIGILFMTGLGLRLSSLIVDASMGNLMLGLVLTMIAGIILGMGMPTSGAYIIMGTLLAPGLIKLGLTTIQAHMFVFYFACMSMLTPPVAIAAYAAASIADADPSKVGFAAWKLALAAFIVPYMFAYGPQLLMVDGVAKSILPFITASIGCITLAAGLEGFLLARASIIERAMLIVSAFLLIETGIVTDLIGLVLFIGVIMLQLPRMRKQVLIERG